MRSAVVAFAAALLVALPLPIRAESVLIEADRDSTLIEDPDGTLSNGAGPYLFVGRTNQGTGSVRRGLLRFDVASALPREAIVDSVTLHLGVAFGNPGTTTVRIHRVMADWGEGASYAEGGRGAPAEPGDATWIHTFYDDAYWKHSGGQFIGRESASFVVDGPGAYALGDTVFLRADVRLWRSNPTRNFGWILIGDETRAQTVQPIATREHPEPGARPALEITYRLPGRPRGTAGEAARLTIVKPFDALTSRGPGTFEAVAPSPRGVKGVSEARSETTS